MDIFFSKITACRKSNFVAFAVTGHLFIFFFERNHISYFVWNRATVKLESQITENVRPTRHGLNARTELRPTPSPRLEYVDVWRNTGSRARIRSVLSVVYGFSLRHRSCKEPKIFRANGVRYVRENIAWNSRAGSDGEEEIGKGEIVTSSFRKNLERIRVKRPFGHSILPGGFFFGLVRSSFCFFVHYESSKIKMRVLRFSIQTRPIVSDPLKSVCSAFKIRFSKKGYARRRCSTVKVLNFSLFPTDYVQSLFLDKLLKTQSGDVRYICTRSKYISFRSESTTRPFLERYNNSCFHITYIENCFIKSVLS